MLTTEPHWPEEPILGCCTGTACSRRPALLCLPTFAPFMPGPWRKLRSVSKKTNGARPAVYTQRNDEITKQGFLTVQPGLGLFQ